MACGTLVRVGHRSRARKISGLKLRDAETCEPYQLVDLAVEVAATSDPPPNRVEAMLPGLNPWVGRHAVLDEQESAFWFQYAFDLVKRLERIGDAAEHPSRHDRIDTLGVCR